MNDISVVVPTYNRFELLRACIISIRSQTLSPREIVVVDDGSTDETAQWCREQPDILLVSCSRAGPSRARNLGAFRSSSKWIAFLDSDDVWLPDHLATVTAVSESVSGAKWVLANAILTDPHLNPVHDVQGFAGAFPLFGKSLTRFNQLFPRRASSVIWQGDARRQALMGNWLQPSGLLILRDEFFKHGGFDEGLWRCEDMDLLLRLVSNSFATLSLRQTYLWRQGQVDSLASHGNALLLKSGAIKVLSRSGLRLSRWNAKLLLFWSMSLMRHTWDYAVAMILRMTQSFESKPAAQAVMQSAVAFLSLLLPVFLARMHSPSEFSEYRIFGLYLSTASSLSLTAGFWSLLPYWKSKGAEAENNPTIGFKISLFFACIYTAIVVILSPLKGQDSVSFANAILGISIILNLGAVFLEQNLAINQRAFAASLVTAFFETAKMTLVLLSTIFLGRIDLVFHLIAFFLLMRFLVLFFANQKLDLIKPVTIHAINSFEILRHALPICLATAMMTLAAHFDRFYLSRNLTSEQFAIVVAGALQIPIVSHMEQSVYQRALPKLATALFERRIGDASIIIANGVRQVSFVAIPMSGFLVVFSADIIQLLFGAQYSQSSSFLAVYSLLNLLACLPADLCARAQGRSQVILLWGALNCVTLCLSVVVGYKAAGSFGAVTAAVSSILLTRAAMLVCELRRVGIGLGHFMRDSVHYKLHALFFVLLCLNLVC